MLEDEYGEDLMNGSDYSGEPPPCYYSEWEHSSSVVPVLYMLVFVFGLSGNGVVICTVWRSRTKRRSADTYIGSLALADLAFVVTLPLWAVYAALDYHWPFGWLLCKLGSYLVMVNMYASVFCLTCLSFDRYLAIVHSLSSARLRSRRSTLLSLTLLWFLAGLLALPALVLRRTHQQKDNRTLCAMNYSWVAGESTEHLWVGGLSLFASTVGFLLPFLMMSTFYCAIARTVTRHFQKVKKEEQKKKRLLKIISALVLVFALCWLPFHIIKTTDALIWLELIAIPCAFDEFIYWVHPYATCAAYINSCLNPFLYAAFDQRFRSQCLCALRCSRLKSALHGPITSISSSISNPTKSEPPSSATKV